MFRFYNIVHSFSRIPFAAKLFTNVVYNSNFVIDYDYIYFLFYIK